MSELQRIQLLEEVRDKISNKLNKEGFSQRVIYSERVIYNKSLEIVNKVIDEIMVKEDTEEVK